MNSLFTEQTGSFVNVANIVVELVMQDQTIYTHPLVETSIIDIWMRKLLAKVVEKVSNFDAALLSEVGEQSLVESVISPMQQVPIWKEDERLLYTHISFFLLVTCSLFTRYLTR